MAVVKQDLLDQYRSLSGAPAESSMTMPPKAVLPISIPVQKNTVMPVAHPLPQPIAPAPIVPNPKLSNNGVQPHSTNPNTMPILHPVNSQPNPFANNTNLRVQALQQLSRGK